MEFVIRKVGVPESVKSSIKEQFERELRALSELLSALNISLTAEDLLEFSGLSVSSYTVKKYSYLKLIGVKTGEKTTKVEGWIVKKMDDDEGKVRERWLRRETVHIKNFHKTTENRNLLSLLLHIWRRAKALKSWLDEVEGKNLLPFGRQTFFSFGMSS